MTMKRVKKEFLLLFLLSCSVITITSAQPILMKSIPLGSTNFVASEGRLFFTSGDSLWTSNGTTAGTYFIKKTNESFSQVTNLRLGTFIYFTTLQSDGKTALWRSNGTGANTTKIAAYSKIFPLLIFNNALYLTIDDGIHGSELWKINVSNNLSMVKDIVPGAGDGFKSDIIISSNILYFTAFGGPGGINIWKSDGTETGTTLAVDLPFTDVYLHRLFLTDVTGTIFFARSFINNNGDIAAEFWKTNGTTAGTTKFKSDSIPDSPYELGSFIAFANKLFYTTLADNMFGTAWMSDGTTNGTKAIISFPDEQYSHFYQVKDYLVITSTVNGSSPTPLRRINASGNVVAFHEFEQHANAAKLASTGKTLFFNDYIEDPLTSNYYNSTDELSQSDLTYENTKSLKELFGTSFAFSDNVAATGDNIYFTTKPYLSTNPDIRDLKLWFYNPTKPSANVPYFTLVNADTDEDIQWLKEGDFIFKSEFPHVNVRYNAPSTPGSVVFKLNGGIYRTENQPPYALAGDASGDYNIWTVNNGTYELKATPYSGSNGNGSGGSPLTIHITIADSSTNNLRKAIVSATTDVSEIEQMEAYPNPSNDRFNFSVVSRQEGIAKAQIYNMEGALVQTILDIDVIKGQTIDFTWNPEASRQGIYLCKFSCGDRQITRKIILTK